MRFPPTSLAVVLVLALAFLRGNADVPPAGQTADAPSSPLSPEQALRTFQLPDGLRMELVAAEPHVMSPVALAWDENGRMFVVEMGDYPLGPKMGRVKLLEDTRGHGRIDRSTVVVDKLSFPNGVMPWRGGILVTSAPDILYFKDTRGDGKMDVRQVLFTGFAESNPQHRFNGLTYGIDNWIYGADGDSKTGIRPGDRSDAKPLAIHGSDFRMRADGQSFELVAGRSQFAMTFDNWGNRFINTNNNHIRHPVMPLHYVNRNPYLGVKEVVDEIAEGGRAARVYPISKFEARFNDPDALGHFTSACAVTIYKGDALPREYHGNAFECEPVHNLVHRDILVPNGVSFAAKSAYTEKEFLASTDNWFRPVNLTVGPDGALYVVDFYRAVIEHPQWIPLDIQKKINLRAGDDRGRIYRIVPQGGVKSVQPRLGTASTAELVAHLGHANAWWRTTAQRLLVERQDKSAIEPLRSMVRESPSAVARLHALWTLAGLSVLDEVVVERALKDSEPGMREHALRCAEPLLSGSPALRQQVLKLAEDKDARVRFQAAFTLGVIKDQRAVAGLARIVLHDAGDSWVRTAVLSSVSDRAVRLLGHIRDEDRGFLAKPQAGAVEFVRALSSVVGARRDADEVVDLLRLLTADARPEPSRWQLAALSGLGESLRRSGKPLEPYLRKAGTSAPIAAWSTWATTTALARERDVSERLDALTLLTLLPSAGATPRLQELLRPQEPPQVQTAAVRALAALPGEQTLAMLLTDWTSRTAPVRREILGVMLARAERVNLLLRAVEKGDIRASEFDAPRRDQLLRHPDRAIQEQARKLFDVQKPSDRQTLIEALSAKVLPLPGDAVRGQKVYANSCANCHRLHGQGVVVGPDLASVSGRSKEALLVDLLDPNRAVDPAYVNYLVVTNDGQSVNGVIVSETANSVTLRRAERQESTVLRRDIAQMESTGVSLMPEGLEKTLSPQDFADLLELLRRGQLH